MYISGHLPIANTSLRQTLSCSPKHTSIDAHRLEPSEIRTPRYSVYQTYIMSPLILQDTETTLYCHLISLISMSKMQQFIQGCGNSEPIAGQYPA